MLKNFLNSVMGAVENGVSKVKDLADNAISNTNKTEVSNHTQYYKNCFQDLNALDSKIDDRKEELHDWELMEEIIAEIKEESNNNNNNNNANDERELSLNANQVFLFGTALGHTSLNIYIQEEDNSWTLIKDLFKVTKDEILELNNRNYFSRDVKIEMQLNDLEEIEGIVEKKKTVIEKEISNLIIKACKVSSFSLKRTTHYSMTYKDLCGIEKTLKFAYHQ